MNIRTLVLLCLGIFAVSHTSAQTFSDNGFANTDWTGTKINDTTAGQSATFTASQTLTGGNPGAFRETTMSYGVGNILVADLNSNFTYNLATQGAIDSISYSYDLNAFTTGISGAIGYDLLVYQDNSYYVSNIEDVSTANSWVNFSHDGLLAPDFTLVDGAGPTHPDFSTSGSNLTFGFASGNGTAFGTGFTDSGLDNFSLTVATPEPSTWAMLLSGLGLLAFWRYHTRRAQG